MAETAEAGGASELRGHRRWACPLLAIAAMAATLPLVAGYWGALHPAFDALVHFRFHLAALVALLALPLLFFRGWRQIALMALVLSAGAVGSTLTYGGGGLAVAAVSQEPSARYRLLHLNLRYDNATPKAVLSLIGRSNADVVVLTEVSDMWRAELAFIEGAYPHRIVCRARAHIGGVAILSRRPFRHPAATACLDRGSMATASISLGGNTITVAALHLGWPWPFDQHEHVNRVRPALASLGPTAILAGDFNASPWSVTTRMVEAAGGLTAPRWVGPTWLKRPLPDFLRRYAGLPIDHILTKGRVRTLSIERLEDVGSDHLPVLMSFEIEPGSEEQPIMQARTSVKQSYIPE